MFTRRVLGLAILGVALVSATVATAQVHVDGYFRPNGTYVQPHDRTPPNGTTLDNWSTRGNVNPYTGQLGTRDPYYTPTPTFRPRR